MRVRRTARPNSALGVLRSSTDGVRRQGVDKGETMSRYIKDLPTALTATQAGDAIAAYLQSEGFQIKDERGEQVWRKGVGALTAPQFFKVAPADNMVHIEAWMAGMALLPGVYLGEMDPTTGVYGWAVKAVQRGRIQALESILTQGATAAAAQPAQAIDAGWYPDPQAKHELRYWDGSGWTSNVSDAGQASVES